MSMGWVFGRSRIVKGIHHTTIINWVKQVGKILPEAYDPEKIPYVGELDRLQTFIASKKTKFGFGHWFDRFKKGILGSNLGDSSSAIAPLHAVEKPSNLYGNLLEFGNVIFMSLMDGQLILV